jgi:hypothetical protein
MMSILVSQGRADFQMEMFLRQRVVSSVDCCAPGYRADDDKYATQKKVRFSREDVIHIV